MDEETVLKAGLAAAVLCRAIDYYVTAKAGSDYIANAPAGKNQQQLLDKIGEAQSDAQKRVAVALENLLDAGLE